MHKIKSIANLVNSEKKLYLCKSGGAQWIGTGLAMFPIYNLPDMGIFQFAKLLDVPAETKARSKYFFKELDDDLFDFVEADAAVCSPLYLNRWSFFRGSTEYMPLCTTKGLVFLDTEWIKPIARSDSSQICEAYNPDQDHSYIIVKEGLYIVAMLEPSEHVLDEIAKKELYAMVASLQVGRYANQSNWYRHSLPAAQGEIVEDEQEKVEISDQLMLGEVSEKSEEIA